MMIPKTNTRVIDNTVRPADRSNARKHHCFPGLCTSVPCGSANAALAPECHAAGTRRGTVRTRAHPHDERKPARNVTKMHWTKRATYRSPAVTAVTSCRCWPRCSTARPALGTISACARPSPAEQRRPLQQMLVVFVYIPPGHLPATSAAGRPRGSRGRGRR
jgi:hypothetical protein